MLLIFPFLSLKLWIWLQWNHFTLWWAGDVPCVFSSVGWSHYLCVNNMSGFPARQQQVYCPGAGGFGDLFRWGDPVMPPLQCDLLLVSSDGVWFLPFLVLMTWEFCPDKHSAVQSSFRAQGDLRTETLTSHMSLNELENESKVTGGIIYLNCQKLCSFKVLMWMENSSIRLHHELVTIGGKVLV